MSIEIDLSGRVALVTGGSRGLGEEIAEGLAEAGASLMLVARRPQWLEPAVERFRARGFSCEGGECDVADPAVRGGEGCHPEADEKGAS